MVTGISPEMLKARLTGWNSSTTGVSTTEELLSEETSDSDTEEVEELAWEELLGLEELA